MASRAHRPRASFFAAPQNEPAYRRLLRYWGTDVGQGALDYALHYAMRALPIAWCSAIGGRLGELVGRYWLRDDDRQARTQYARLRGGQASEAEIDRASRRLWNHIGRVIAEFSVLDRLWDSGRIAVAGEANLAAARARGPMLVMAVHVGNWEAVLPALVGLGYRTSGIYQPPRNRFQHRIAVTARERCGSVRLLKPDVLGTRAAYRVLRTRDGLLMIHVDEAIRRRVNAPLFGRRASHRSNLMLTARLAMMTGAAVVPVMSERIGGARFRVSFGQAVTLAGDPRNAADLDRAIARLDGIVTPWVLAHLDQWLWLQDRRLGRNS